MKSNLWTAAPSKETLVAGSLVLGVPIMPGAIRNELSE